MRKMLATPGAAAVMFSLSVGCSSGDDADDTEEQTAEPTPETMVVQTTEPTPATTVVQTTEPTPSTEPTW
jgi:hypothetical protein